MYPKLTKKLDNKILNPKKIGDWEQLTIIDYNTFLHKKKTHWKVKDISSYQMLILKPEFHTGIYNFLFSRIICITGWLQINFIMDAISFPNRPDSKATRIPEQLQRRLESSVPRWTCSESGCPRPKLTDGSRKYPEFVFRKKNALPLDCSYFLLRSKLFNGANITYSNRNFRFVCYY